MGQYYKIALKRKGSVVINDRSVKGCGYIMAKLMEHSYFGNFIIDAVAGILERGACRLAWVGDYADEDVEAVTKGDVTYDMVWGENAKNKAFNKVKFDYGGKYLVNHTKKVCISFDEYLKTQKGDWKISPISLLTAIGNGRGGGDYHDGYVNYDKVGSWAWDEIEITKDRPDGYEEVSIWFSEETD